MFVLSILKDTVSVHPTFFSLPREQAIISALNKKYANRVLHDVGLCVCVFDLTEAGYGRVRYGDGMFWYKVQFRLVVFRPFRGEVILARVKSMDENGIRLSMDFFDDIHVPVQYLPKPSAFDPNERAWFWASSLVSDDPSAPEPSRTQLLDLSTDERNWVDIGETVRVRVESDVFIDEEPGPPVVGKEERAKKPPYQIECLMAEDGLGPVQWWQGGAEADDAMEEE